MNGLDGVVAAETKLSMVDGERGELIIAGYRVADLAPNATFAPSHRCDKKARRSNGRSADGRRNSRRRYR
jgi:citrate synthase